MAVKPLKPLDDFETERMVIYLAYDLVNYMADYHPSAASARRLRYRVRRFVLTHPQVTPRLATLFNAIVRGKEVD